MKAFLVVLLFGSTLAYAQEFVAPKAPEREIVPKSVIVTKPTIEGIVKEIFVTKKPWQMINPLAPAKYGSGEKFVSRDFGPSTPYHSATVTLLSVEW